METIEPDDNKVEVLFAFPFLFYHAAHIETGYNKIHSTSSVEIVLDEERNVFHLFCRPEDIDQHGNTFPSYVKSFVNAELERSDKDLIIGDPPQVEQLWGITNSRSKFYDLARRETASNEGIIQRLIETDQFTQTIPYRNRINKARDTNQNLFRTIAAKNECDLEWRKTGLQVLSNNQECLKRTVKLLSPAVALLEGVTTNLYWIDIIVGLHLRFAKLARAADHSVYEIKNLMTTFFDLQLVRWDPVGLQHVTLKPKKLENIAYPKQTRNTWHRNIKIRYGSDTNAPTHWMNGDELSLANLSALIDAERTKTIESWMTNLDEPPNDATQPEMIKIPSSASPERDQGILWADGQRIGKLDVENVRGKAEQTDIEERRKALDEFDLDKPRIRPAPRLKAAAGASSSRESSLSGRIKRDRPDFITIFVNEVAKLITSVKLHIKKSSSCTIDIGQLFISSAGIPSQYQPNDGRVAGVFQPMEWEDFFGENPTKTKSGGAYFSNRLTSSDDDALFMANTPLRSPKRNKSPETVFQLKAWSDRAYYRICCQNISTGTIGLIEIDNEQNISIKVEARKLGYINLHFPQYMWDARVTASVTPHLPSLDEQDFRNLLSTIWIGDTDPNSSKSEKLYARKQEHIKIISCRRIRERIQRTTENLPDDRAIYLHINKVEDLQIANISSTPGGFCAFSTTADRSFEQQDTHVTRKRKQRIWYEAAIHSESINRILPGPSESTPYSQHSDDVDDFMPPTDNEPLKRFLRSELAPLFNATHGLVTAWNNVGARDRAKAPVDLKGEMRMVGGTAVPDGSSASALASRDRVMST